MFVNNEKKVVFCSINKVGTFSNHNYFIHLNQVTNETRKVNKVRGVYTPDFKHPDIGYYFMHVMKRVPLNIALRRFGQFRKFILVRHPLQRFVAAYYEVRKQGYPNTTSLSEFVSKRLLTNRIDDVHWLDYQQFCLPHRMHYDYILKLETFTSDNAEMNRLLGESYQYRELHKNRKFNSTAAYKYDDILRDFELRHPLLFQQVWNKYSVDMDMFGYTWHNGTSGCRYNTVGCC